MGAYLAGDLKNGKFSLKEAWKRIDWIGVGGQTIGSVAGAALGSFLGPVGTVLGGMIGGYIGNWAAHKIAGLFGYKTDGQQLGQTTVVVPVGTIPGGRSDSYPSGVTIGNQGSTGSTVVVGNDVPELVIPGGSVDSVSSKDDITLVYERYQDLYKLYSDLMSKGKQTDAQKIVPEMNKAKAEFDKLRLGTK
jgi:hypothetical protein